MTNQQLAIIPNQIATSSRCSREIREALRQRLKHADKAGLRRRVYAAASQCLATLAASGIMLAAIYLFLVQLAEGGW